ncbi:Bet v I/Major latex protein [Dillenia turbinata]|uniref:Bet v I/Major latex protein n=1 Tax=Dillenia turbinata TaxID=194707 RepID=A0AAN8ZDY3_9MAGN
MSAVTYSDEITSPVAASRVFKALILDADNLLPKLLPQAIASIETVEGDGGVGSVKQINFAEGKRSIHILVHKINALDQENLSYSYSFVGADAFMDKIESISYEVKFEAAADGASLCKSVTKYYPKAGVEITEEAIKPGKEKTMGMFKVVEAYLLANPEAYA